MAAHVARLRTDIDGHGVAGMERVLDERLTDPALRGAPVALSIDSARAGGAGGRARRARSPRCSAEGGAGIVLDVDTGEVIALASLPSSIPTRAGMAGAERAATTARRMGVYELGSTFKPITVAAAIEAGVITSMAQRFDATAPLQVGGFTISDDHPLGTRSLNMPEMLIHSSNIATAQIADEIGAARMQAMFRAARLRRAGPNRAARARPPALADATGAAPTVMTVGYRPRHRGHAAAPRQRLCGAGQRRHLAAGDAAEGRAGPGAAGRRVFSETTSARMRQLLRMIVHHGTGRKANAPGFRVGGKTGTAEKSRGGRL